MFYIFEMANNHQGSVEHAKNIVKEFAKLAKENKINAGVKLQFRQLDSFIHKDFKDSDLKFVKRFNSTRLEKEQFKEIVDCIRENGLSTIATPFDNESLSWLDDLGVSIVKIASCSIDDWPLLREVCKINKKIVISTAGAELKHLKKVYDLFKFNKRDFAFMHCVGEYPTSASDANLDRITKLRNLFPDVEIGFSTHESPKDASLAPVARALGCTILEKHVGVPTNEYPLNGYSCTSSDIKKVIDEIKSVTSALYGKSENEKQTLLKLKRGVYLKNSVNKGDTVSEADFYYALPVQDNQFDVSSIDEIVGTVVKNDLYKDSPLCKKDIKILLNTDILEHIKDQTLRLLKDANVTLCGKENVELSAHYGLKRYNKTGALIIDKINREYCKKIIVLLPEQDHPTHHHIKKEEAFELLYGDCELTLNGKPIDMKVGDAIVISRGVKHSFKSKNGCVIEEVSTTHLSGDSVYDDPVINSLKISDRKIKIKMEQENV